MTIINIIKMALCILLGWLYVNICMAEYQYKSTPALLENYTFSIDDIKYSITVPTGGIEGGFTVSQLESKEINERNLILLTIGFDQIVTVNRQYNLTHFLFGLTKDGCCSIDSANKFETSSHNKTEVVEIEGMETLYAEITNNNNDFIALFYVPYNTRYNLVLSMRIDNEIANDKKFIETRIEMLRGIVGSLKKINN